MREAMVQTLIRERMEHVRGLLPDGVYARIHETMPILCVDVVPVVGKSVALVRRGRMPGKGKWWFPGGRVRRGEVLEDAARRLLLDEMQAKLRRARFLGVIECQFGKEDPFGHGKGTHTVSVVYGAEMMPGGVTLDANHIEWGLWRPGEHPLPEESLDVGMVKALSERAIQALEGAGR
jgi:colanic acid biosynthesis protein WcaH